MSIATARVASASSTSPVLAVLDLTFPLSPDAATAIPSRVADSDRRDLPATPGGRQA